MRVKLIKGILWFFVGLAATVAVFRFLKGLGTVTALTDTTPWGLWIGFDVLGGVALAAGGFVIAACVYIFHMEKYRPILRPAVLTAFLGYVAVAVGLLFDIGIPWNIWRPMLFWQHHSALFEVAWCVMLYLTVLALEFTPVVLERLPFKMLYKILKAVTLPLVILGIVLSTLFFDFAHSVFRLGHRARAHNGDHRVRGELVAVQEGIGKGFAQRPREGGRVGAGAVRDTETGRPGFQQQAPLPDKRVVGK
jgi:Ni/Fe-hydrogenase subunit HybB-like protein